MSRHHRARRIDPDDRDNYLVAVAGEQDRPFEAYESALAYAYAFRAHEPELFRRDTDGHWVRYPLPEPEPTT